MAAMRRLCVLVLLVDCTGGLSPPQSKTLNLPKLQLPRDALGFKDALRFDAAVESFWAAVGPVAALGGDLWGPSGADVLAARVAAAREPAARAARRREERAVAAKRVELSLTWVTAVLLGWRLRMPLCVRLSLRLLQLAAPVFLVLRIARLRATAHKRTFGGVSLYLRGTASATARATAIADEIIAARRAVVDKRLRRRLRWGTAMLPAVDVAFWQPPLRVLCLDGGGTKGRNLLVTVRELERRTGRPVADLFDVVCGTSIGGCGALFMASFGSESSGKAAAAFEALQLRCFAKSSKTRFLLEGHRCEDERVALVQELLGGADVALTDVVAPSRFWSKAPPRAFAVAARPNPSTGRPEPYLFRTYAVDAAAAAMPPLPGTSDSTITAAIAATSAAPTYFAASLAPTADGGTQVLADGGCAFNNPTLLALHEISAVWPHRRVGVVVSLGCGHVTGAPPRGAARREEAITDAQARRVCDAALPDTLYARLCPPLDVALKPNEHREDLLASMERRTQAWLDGEARQALDDVIARL
ncbi:acyl transferase/acyl hydrolase/lysophospholipase [Pelagophyceae sp. CCMP2097]|nr:acyl transferase/acyl hydrolase/lysophospholipase [Pelagophyceae sp. CCMP2097]